MPMNLCTLCTKVLTNRADGLCEPCHKARQLIETSVGQAHMTRIILDLEAEWRMLNRIDNELLRERYRKQAR